MFFIFSCRRRELVYEASLSVNSVGLCLQQRNLSVSLFNLGSVTVISWNKTIAVFPSQCHQYFKIAETKCPKWREQKVNNKRTERMFSAKTNFLVGWSLSVSTKNYYVNLRLIAFISSSFEMRGKLISPFLEYWIILNNY